MPAHPINPAVLALAEARHVSIKTAYNLHKREQMESLGHAPQSQREQVLMLIHKFGGRVRDARVLGEAMRTERLLQHLDGHDLTKVLWSLQKTSHVRFRESQKFGLHAIRLTREGVEEVQRLQSQYTNGSVLREAEASVALDHDPDMQTQVLETEPAPEPVFPDDVPEVGFVSGPEPQRTLDVMRGLDLIKDIVYRKAQADRYSAVAAAAEDLGETDIALTLYDKVRLSPLEEEVATLISRIDLR